MRAISSVVALICAAYLSGCGAHENAKRPPHPSATTGTVQGQVLRPPGIDPRSGAAVAPVPVNADPVEAHDLHGRLVKKAVTVPRGRFRMELAPGTYRIIEGICGVSKRVAVHGGSTTSVTLRIPNAC